MKIMILSMKLVILLMKIVILSMKLVSLLMKLVSLLNFLEFGCRIFYKDLIGNLSSNGYGVHTKSKSLKIPLNPPYKAGLIHSISNRICQDG